MKNKTKELIGWIAVTIGVAALVMMILKQLGILQ